MEREALKHLPAQVSTGGQKPDLISPSKTQSWKFRWRNSSSHPAVMSQLSCEMPLSVSFPPQVSWAPPSEQKSMTRW